MLDLLLFIIYECYQLYLAIKGAYSGVTLRHEFNIYSLLKCINVDGLYLKGFNLLIKFITTNSKLFLFKICVLSTQIIMQKLLVPHVKSGLSQHVNEDPHVILVVRFST